MKRIFFEDHGQDFLWWDIDHNGLVTDAGPFQASVWMGCKVSRLDKIGPGKYVHFIARDCEPMVLNYKIEKITAL